MKTHRPFPSALFHVLFAILAVSSSARTADNPTPQGKTQHLTAPDQVPEGLAKSDWGSIRAAYEAGRHAFEPIEGGWQARNPGQQWTTKFDRRGFVTEPKGGGWQWGLELKGYGFPGAMCRHQRRAGGEGAGAATHLRLGRCGAGMVGE